MKKIEFIKDSKFGKHEKATSEKYLLLALFIGQFRFPDNIQEIIEMLEPVKNGSKTWLEVNDSLMFLQIGYDCGDFKCDKETAYFISGNPIYQDLNLPLSEVIELMKEWKIFMS